MTLRIFMPVGGTGGGPTESPFREELWYYLLEKARSTISRQKVALLTTPSQLCGDKINIKNLVANHKNLEKKLACTFHLVDEARFGRGEYDGEFDVLCITCGNTAGARESWEKTGCEQVIRNWYTAGVLCAGYSAGFILFYEWASTDSVPGPEGTQFGIMPGMGIIKGAAIPHADIQSRRISDFQLSLKEHPIDPVLALGEDVMAVYINEAMKDLVSPISNPVACLVTDESREQLKVKKA